MTRFASRDVAEEGNPMLIDSHHHFWRYDPTEYGWINDEMSTIRRDFLPADLKRETDALGLDGVVSVQARQTLEETHWLLEMAEANDFIKGVVGWVPLVSPTVADDLAELTHHRKFKAVRHVLQDEPDGYMARDDFNAGVNLLKPLGLEYDLLIYERQLPEAIQFVDRHPGQLFVVDHIAKPRIKENVVSPWRENILELAHRPNVYCKISGMATEADYSAWTPQQLKPYFDTALEAFGPHRLMFGTDWPVCQVACDYGRWYRLVREWAASLSDHDQDRLFGETAMEAYKLQ